MFCMQADISRLVGKSDVPAEVATAVRNNGGGHWNHSFFWTVLAKAGTEQSDYESVASDQLKQAIKQEWGSLNAFQAKFNEAATAVFGSGCEFTFNYWSLMTRYCTSTRYCTFTWLYEHILFNLHIDKIMLVPVLCTVCKDAYNPLVWPFSAFARLDTTVAQRSASAIMP